MSRRQRPRYRRRLELPRPAFAMEAAQREHLAGKVENLRLAAAAMAVAADALSEGAARIAVDVPELATSLCGSARDLLSASQEIDAFVTASARSGHVNTALSLALMDGRV